MSYWTVVCFAYSFGRTENDLIGCAFAVDGDLDWHHEWNQNQSEKRSTEDDEDDEAFAGDCESGDCESGDYESGDYESGDCESGDCESGDCESGDCESGDCCSCFRSDSVSVSAADYRFFVVGCWHDWAHFPSPRHI